MGTAVCDARAGGAPRRGRGGG
eukprot:SAG31_NODE_28602_length_407_cov_2.561688_1_plen_21_part_10